MTGHESGKSARRTTSRNDHDHGPTAQLLGEAWCITCHHSHIATIPSTTFRCAGDDRPCGFGCWGVTVAAAHADTLPRHIVYPVLHQMVAAHPAPVPAATLTHGEAVQFVQAIGRVQRDEEPVHSLLTLVESILAARQPATVDAETLAKVRALRPTGEREWRNQGRSGTTPTVDYRDLRAALASAVVPAPEGETGQQGRCRCETLPADFGVGINHARACPAGHDYRPRGGVSLIAKPCLECPYPLHEHRVTATQPAPEGETEALSSRLKAVREQRGLTYREAAEQIGCTPSTVHKIEHGGDPRWSVVQRVLAWLDRGTS